MRNIIAIGYKQRRGKDTVALFLKQAFPSYRIISLAAAIKKRYAEERGLSEEEVEMAKTIDPQVRSELVKYGQQERAEKGESVWVDMVLNQTGSLIIPDLRMRHERDRILEVCPDAYFINVVCSRDEAKKRGTLTDEDAITESELDQWHGWDSYVSNEGDLNFLFSTVHHTIVPKVKAKFGLTKSSAVQPTEPTGISP